MSVEFLVENVVTLPAEMPEARRQLLLEEEHQRARDLLRQGVIQRIWRIPGGLRNVGVWRVADANELQVELASLPLSPWLESTVTPLASHPVEEGARDR
jgi:muconolactone D-isomerase